ncbi:MAG: hypothetical protein V1725_04385 [archaeon]
MTLENKALLTLNGENSFISLSDPDVFEGRPCIDHKALFTVLPKKAIDTESLLNADMQQFHKTIDETTTQIGSATFYRSLCSPLTNPDDIIKKQHAVQELESNNLLRQRVQEYLGEFVKVERDLFRFLMQDGDRPRDTYTIFKKAQQAAAVFSDLTASNGDGITSDYLKTLLRRVMTVDNSRPYRMLVHNPYLTFNGVVPLNELKWYIPRRELKPSPWTLDAIALPLFSTLGTGGILDLMSTGIGQYIAIGTVSVGTAMGLAGYLSWRKNAFYEKVMQPIKTGLLNDAAFNYAMEATGTLDELLSFITFRKRYPNMTCMPKIVDGPEQYIKTKNLKSPVMIMQSDHPGFDIDLSEQNNMVVTGRHSTGKSKLGRRLFYAAVQAQTGSHVMADAFEIVPADKLFFHMSMMESAGVQGGGVEQEFAYLKSMWDQSTPKTFIIMHDVGGTLPDSEVIAQEKRLMGGYYRMGGTTILITSYGPLAKDLADSGLAACIHAELRGKAPTGRFVPGIHHESNIEYLQQTSVLFTDEEISSRLAQFGR